MSWVKYNLTLLFFITTVAVGISVALSEFNRMVHPAGPVSAFSLKGGESGVYHMELLGEKIRISLPESFVTDLFAGETVENSKRYITEAFKNLKQNGGQVLEKSLFKLKDTGGKMASDVDSSASLIRKALPLKEWFPAGGAEER